MMQRKKSGRIAKAGNSFQKSNRPVLVFLLKFFGIFIVLEALVNLIDLRLLTDFIASAVATFFNLPYENSTILLDSASFVVTNSCTGLVSLSILASITLPLKGLDIKKRLLIVGIGAVLLLTLNVPRIGLVVYSGMLGYDAEMVHEITWFFMSALILLIWYFGVKFIQKEDDFSRLI